MGDKILKSNEEWKKQLSPELYHIAREKGTERPFSGKYVHEKAPGTYICACCGAELFQSQAKFDSGCGWPSFDRPLDPGAVESHDDLSLGRHRIEITCTKCGAHLGHVFPDGPTDTGDRYCINSVSLGLKPKA